MRERTKTPRGGRVWAVVVPILLFVAAIGTLIAPAQLLGDEARSLKVGPAPSIARLSDMMIAAAALCALMLVFGAIRRTSSPRLFVSIVRLTVSFGLVAVIILCVLIAERIPDLRREGLFAEFFRDSAVQGLGVSTVLVLFGCGIVGFSVFGPRGSRIEAVARREVAPMPQRPPEAATASMQARRTPLPMSRPHSRRDAAPGPIAMAAAAAREAALAGAPHPQPKAAERKPVAPPPGVNAGAAAGNGAFLGKIETKRMPAAQLAPTPPHADPPPMDTGVAAKPDLHPAPRAEAMMMGDLPGAMASIATARPAAPRARPAPARADELRGTGHVDDTVHVDDVVMSVPVVSGWDDAGIPTPAIELGERLPAPIAKRNGSAMNGAGHAADAEMPSGEDLRAQIRRKIAAKPPYTDEAKALLQLMASHDAGFAAALMKLPERQGLGGAVTAAMIQDYQGNVDLVLLARAVTAAMIFWPEKGPSHTTIEEIALRLAEFSHDAAREFARAYALLGNRFSLQYSLKVVLQKYAISQASFDAMRPDEGMTENTVRGMLSQDRIDLMNEILRPFEITILEKIGTVVPVYSVLEKNHDRYVMNANEFVEFLRRRSIIT